MVARERENTSDDRKSKPVGGGSMDAAQVKVMGLMGLWGFGGKRKLKGFGYDLKNDDDGSGGDGRIAMEEAAAM